MKAIIVALATLLFACTAKAADSSYEIDQPLAQVIAKMSAPGADEKMMSSSEELVKKTLETAGFVWGKKTGLVFSMTHEMVVRRGTKLLTFNDVVFFQSGKVTSTTTLVDSGGSRLDEYKLVTRLIGVGKKTVVEHDLEIVVDGIDRGFRYIIARRVALARVQSGIRRVLDEPRPVQEE